MHQRRAVKPLLTIERSRRLLASGLISSEQLCSFCQTLAVAGEQQWKLNAFTRLKPTQELLEQARASDERRRKGYVSPMEGIPMSIKANLAVSTQPLTAASGVLRDETPCGFDADAVSRLENSGAIIMGITNMDEFGMGSLGSHAASSEDGQTSTRNPFRYMSHLKKVLSWDDNDDSSISELIKLSSDYILEAHEEALARDGDNPILSAGGSSCGSAASVAHGSSLASLGTDTGGSVRLPSAWCGIVGLKPSYGLISRHGVVSYASSLDTVGILAPSVDCVRTVLECLAQHENDNGSRDSTASFYDSCVPSLSSLGAPKEPSGALSGIKIGIPSAFSVADCPESIRQVWNIGAHSLQDNGADVKTISTDVLLPELIRKSLAAYYILASAEASSNLSRYDGVRYGPAASIDHEQSQVDTDTTPLEELYSATRSEGFGTEVVRRILCGTSVLSSDRFHTHYEAAAKLRAALTKQFHRAFEEVDVLLIPTVLSLPCSLTELPDSTEMFANDVMTVPISLAGLPSVSVPVTVGTCDDAASVGLQLVGSRLNERVILDVAKVLEGIFINDTS